MSMQYLHMCRFVLWLFVGGWASWSLADSQSNDAGIETLRIGLFAHNQGLVASKVESGADLNVEISVQPIEQLWGAEPSIGVMLNNMGYTSYLYTGFSWEIGLFQSREDQGLFFTPFLGVAVHNGEADPNDNNRGLGCRGLFREAIEIGWRFSEVWAVSVLTDHLSHGGLCADRNQGLDNSGVRLHWRL